KTDATHLTRSKAEIHGTSRGTRSRTHRMSMRMTARCERAHPPPLISCGILKVPSPISFVPPFNFRGSCVPLSKRTWCCVVGLLLLGRPAAAQEQPWEPLGLMPVDQAGAGLRGYATAGEDAQVSEPRTDQVSIHTVVANNFYREQTDSFLIT